MRELFFHPFAVVPSPALCICIVQPFYVSSPLFPSLRRIAFYRIWRALFPSVPQSYRLRSFVFFPKPVTVAECVFFFPFLDVAAFHNSMTMRRGLVFISLPKVGSDNIWCLLEILKVFSPIPPFPLVRLPSPALFPSISLRTRISKAFFFSEINNFFSSPY